MTTTYPFSLPLLERGTSRPLNIFLTAGYFFSKKSFVKCKNKNKMPTKEQLQDMVEALTTLNIRQLDEEGRDEAEYLVNDIIISIEELMDFF